MRYPGLFLPGLLAPVISVLILPGADECLARGGSTGRIDTGTPETSDHSEFSLSTGLWRSVFVDSDETNEESVLTGPKNIRQPGDLTRSVRRATRELATVQLDREFMEGIALSIETAPDLSISETKNLGVISDWEHAASSAVGPLNSGATRSGPSMISLIVGVVGLVVVIGAYVNSARNP